MATALEEMVAGVEALLGKLQLQKTLKSGQGVAFLANFTFPTE